MKKALFLASSIAALLTLTGCAVRGPSVWIEPPRYYVPVMVVEPAPAVVIYEQRHYHEDRHYHKKQKRHYHRGD